jgi:5-methyltetrahydrofolate--homocysteine methyltransferase
MMLENYGYEVIDLGRDVPAELVASTIREKNIRLAGLSALMTTTVQNMKKTIELCRGQGLDCRFLVGGAVLNEDYTVYVGADYFARDAMQSVEIANRFFGENG